MLSPPVYKNVLYIVNRLTHYMRDQVDTALMHVQAARLSYIPRGVPFVHDNWQPKDYHATTNAHHTTEAAKSKEEAYMRSGIWSSGVTQDQASRGEGYRKRPHSISDSQRRPKRHCSKKQNSSGNLSPGLMV